MKKISIFEVGANYRAILQELEENGGELTEEIQDFLAVNNDDFEEKAEAYSIIIDNSESEIQRAKLSISNLQNKIKIKEKLIAYLKEKLKNTLMLDPLAKKITKTGNVAYEKEFANSEIRLFSKNSKKVEIYNDKVIEEKELGTFTLTLVGNRETIDRLNEKAQQIAGIFSGKRDFSSNKDLIKEAINKGEITDKEAALIDNYNLTIK
jgi:hypothetical protein